jgi:hypothetical protein
MIYCLLIKNEIHTLNQQYYFYQRLEAKTMENVGYLLPKLSEENAPKMILMLYLSYPKNWISGDLVKQLIFSIYEHFLTTYSPKSLFFM